MRNSLLKRKFPPNLKEIYDEKLANQLAKTQGAIGSLLQTSRLLQNPDLLMNPILAKEAESSSQLKGIQASISDAYQIDLIKQSAEKKNDAQEIINYERAMKKGVAALKTYGLNELSIREMHKALLSGVRGEDKNPGEYRKEDVWIGKLGTSKGRARYLPPEPLHVSKLMEDLAKFIQANGDINPLIACGVIHHRFEAVHPFKDGNGRVGRLLITLYLMKEGLLEIPVLYPSGYFEERKPKYLDALSKVDKNEDWYSWLYFFLVGIQAQAELSLKLMLQIDALYKEAQLKVSKQTANINLIKVLDYSFYQPYLTASLAHKATEIPLATTKRYINLLEKVGVIEGLGKYKKQNVYFNRNLIDILQAI